MAELSSATIESIMAVLQEVRPLTYGTLRDAVNDALIDLAAATPTGGPRDG